MATFLDVTGLEYFSNIFVFLFVWIVVYATLLWTKIVGNNKIVITLLGLLLGIFVLISPLATNVVAKTAPFLAVIFVLILLMNIASKMLGAEVESFPALKGVLIVFIVIIVLIGVGVQIKEQASTESSSTDLSKTTSVIFHPKFLGIVLLFAIAIFTIALLASRNS